MKCFDFNFEFEIKAQELGVENSSVSVVCLGNFGNDGVEKWIHIYVAACDHPFEITGLIKALDFEIYKDIETECDIKIKKWIESHNSEAVEEGYDLIDIAMEEAKDGI